MIGGGYDELAVAIIRQGVIDYRVALMKLDKNPDSTKDKQLLQETKEFFESEWLTELAQCDILVSELLDTDKKIFNYSFRI